jgi:hypothetical protein
VAYYDTMNCSKAKEKEEKINQIGTISEETEDI